MKYGNIKKDNFYFEIKHNESDEFSQCLIINSMYVRNGGTPINYILNKIINPIKDKLVKKYPSIKPGDIKNKLKILLVIRFFPKLEYSSQEKIEVTNSMKDFDEYFKDINWDKVVRQILKDDDIILNITEYFKLKQEAKERAELKKLKKVKKKIKSDKYIPGNNKKYLVICEGESATGGIIPVLGKEDFSYYILKGKPLNVYEISQKKFLQNKELSELYQVIQNENFEKIIVATDSDLDGIHINSILIVFFYRYFPHLLQEGKITRFNTPIAASIDKNKKLKEWVYSYDEINKLKGEIKYYKGLGSWTPKQLEQVIQKDGFNNMLIKFNYNNNDKEYIDLWFSGKRSDDRKEMIMNNEFDIMKV